MKFNKEKTGPCEYTLTIEVDDERLQKALQDTARELARRSPVPGFRPGKAPFHIIQAYFGKDVLFGRAMDTFAPQFYEEALKETGIDPYEPGKVDIDQKEPLVLKAVVAAKPVVVLGDYRAIREEAVEIPVNEAEIEKTLQQLREQHAEWKRADRPAQEGDQVIINLKGTVGGEAVLTQNSRRTQVTNGMFPEGLFERVKGAKAGDVIDYEVSYPADHFNPRFAGKTVSFHLEVLEVNEKVLPELDDELAQRLGDYQTVEKLREGVYEKLYKSKQDDARNQLEEKLLKRLQDISTLEYPKVAVDREVEKMIAETRRRVLIQGFSWEAYLNAQKKTEDELREEIRPEAEERLRQSLLLSKIAELEGIAVTDAEVDAEVERLMASYGEQARFMKQLMFNEAGKASLKQELLLNKAMEKVIAIATGKAEEKPVEQPAEQPVAEGEAVAKEDSPQTS